MVTKLLRKLTAAAVAMVLAGGIAGAAEDSAVAGSPGDPSRTAQIADQNTDTKPQVDSVSEAAQGQDAPMGHKCPMGEGDCPHKQHGEGGMSGDPADTGKAHKCPMGEGDCPHMHHGEGGMNTEDKPAGGEKDKT